MANFTIEEMQQMQKKLQAHYCGQWEPISPAVGRNKLLWMIGEIGEVIDLIKKHGHEKVMTEKRSDLVEEMADVLMYYQDTLLRYHITADEISDAFARKHDRNMGRNYTAEYMEKNYG